MNKKIFTLLLLAVFVLAQFSLASADALEDVTATIDPLPTFSAADGTLTINYHLVLPADAQQNVLLWTRYAGTDWSEIAGECKDLTGNVNNLLEAVGTYDYVLDNGINLSPSDGDVIEFYITVNDNDVANGCVASNAADLNTAFNAVDSTLEPLASTYIDDYSVAGFMANPPSTDYMSPFSALTVACNTFEMWSLVNDAYNVAPDAYSGFAAWNQIILGVFAPPAPVGSTDAMLEWQYTFPATATGPWMFAINPTDAAGNDWGGGDAFRALEIQSGETDECADFSDVAGDDNELYIRYLASLDLIAGNPDGSYGPANTLTRAEASVLFAKANGDDETTIPASAPAGCSFTDVTASDWFAGWVWAACEDGFMNGIGGGLFDPSNLLTRGQVVTIFNNIYEAGSGTPKSYFDDGFYLSTVLNYEWGGWGNGTANDPYLRSAAWTDVLIGAYYTTPVIRAYEVGVAEGTSATTFSPDAPISRGLFAKWLYKAVSRAY